MPCPDILFISGLYRDDTLRLYRDNIKMPPWDEHDFWKIFDRKISSQYDLNLVPICSRY